MTVLARSACERQTSCGPEGNPYFIISWRPYFVLE